MFEECLKLGSGIGKEGFPGVTSGKEPACQCRRRKRLRFDPWVRKIPWRRAWQSTPVFLSGESHGQRSLAATVHGVALQLQSAAKIFLYHLPVRFPALLPPHRFPSFWTVLPFPWSLPLPFLMKVYFPTFLFLFIYFCNLTLKAQAAFS